MRGTIAEFIAWEMAALERAHAAGWVIVDGPKPAAACQCTPAAPEDHSLTPRQQDVMSWVARGHSNKQIARKLGISPSTVKAHVAAILRQTGFATRGELIAASCTQSDMRTSDQYSVREGQTNE